MNKLDAAKRSQILGMLCEGMSMRAIEQLIGVSINTVSKLLIDAGPVCARLHDEMVRDVRSKRIQADEIWSFCYAKEKNVATAKAAPERAGSVWTWTAIDSDSKLIVSYLIGGRDAEYANAFMQDLQQRVVTRMQLTTDGHHPYFEAVDKAFGPWVDYAQLVKTYGNAPAIPEARYSPAICTGAAKKEITGTPDNAHISTSYVERSNLSMRMHMRHYTRLTNAHSNKFENHCHMVALYTVWYNFARINSAVKMSPAMAAGLANGLWSMSDIVAAMDAAEGAPKKRGPDLSQKEGFVDQEESVR